MEEYPNIKMLCDLYLENKVSESTLSAITMPMSGLPIAQRERIASKIMALAEVASSEQDLINRVQQESVHWT